MFGSVGFGSLVLEVWMTQAVIGSADQIQRVATLLGKAALRWRRE